MSRKRVLVIGGTGVTGPFIVNGLLKRGHEVTILHSGLHSVEFDSPVERLHGDVHFVESLQATLGHREFDVTLALYGRLRFIADVMSGRTDQFIAAGGMFYRGWHRRDLVRESDDQAMYSSLELPTPEEYPFSPNSASSLVSKGSQSETHVLNLHNQGRFSASVFRLPRIYGPRALAGVEWSIIRRLLDGRRRIIVPDGGMIAESRAYAANAAHMILLALDYPSEVAGQIFNAADERVTTLREWILTIARAMDVQDLELESVPYRLAFPAYPYSRDPFVAGHRVLDITKAKAKLKYRDVVPFSDAIAKTVAWYLENPPTAGSEMERQLGDAFDYACEDELLGRMDDLTQSISQIERKPFTYVHPYRHPAKPDELPKQKN